jgi:uncharacterized protein (TIGR02680 family)
MITPGDQSRPSSSSFPSHADSSPVTTPLTLPSPARTDRWQPLRSGVLNLYRYDYEEFHYADGRLLLRGNNGSGKSRVLALQLPFLLDGEVSPARVEPDGDSAKRIEWNLLMGRHTDRTGYTWIEFGRRDADGTEHFRTLGCGLRAVAGHSGLHSRWFFVTPQRIGRDLFLQTAQRSPLGRDRLAAALGPVGKLFLKAEDYRRAVDDALFGLGARYGPLLELLLRLRRPQLSRKLDEDELSHALSDALPTLPAAIIDEVAESFQSLQADRERLREFTAAHAAVVAFLGEYRAYVRLAVRRRARTFRTTHSAYEAAQRAARDAQSRFESADATLASLTALQAELDTRHAGAVSAERTLRESPEMRTAAEVQLAGEFARAAAAALAAAESDEHTAASSVTQAQSREQSAIAQSAEVERDFAEKRRAAAAAAQSAELADAHREHTDEPALRRVLLQRDRALALLRTREKAVAAAEQFFRSAEESLHRAEAAATAAREAEHTARAALAAVAERLVADYTAWRSSTRHLSAPSAELLAEDLAAWVEQRRGPSPLLTAAASAHTVALATFSARASALDRTAADLAAQLQELDTAIDRLEHGDTPPPPPPVTRRTDRTARPGAPLWRLCDFHSDVPDADRAGLEAALHASGLLDAWVLPDGRILTDTDDTFLLAPLSDTTSPHPHLGTVLTISLDSTDPSASASAAATLARTLAQIGYGPDTGPHWIAPDGRWQLGPLAGRASQATADYLGESTRAAARGRQLIELRAQHAAAAAAQLATAAQLAALAADRNAASAELAAAPADEPVLRAGYALEAATTQVADTHTAGELAARTAATLRTERDTLAAQRDRDAADLHLSAWLGRLDALATATQHYATALAALWPTARHWATVAAQLAALHAHTAEAQATLDTRRTRREQAAAESAAARQRYETLEETHGQAVSVILEKLATATAEVARLNRERHTNQSQQLAQTAARATAQSDHTSAEQQRTAAEAQRALALLGLQRLAEQRLLAEADPTLRDIEPDEWSVARVVDLVRHRLDPLLADTPDDDTAWQRRQDAIHGHVQELRDQLITHGHPPETHQSDDLVLVRCLFQTRPHSMTELRDAFAGELQERERLLQAKEREIIENHLLAEAAVELQKLIRAAETWRASANDELNSRPTSSGVRFRFQWEPDTEIRFQEIRPILLRKGDLWTPTERTTLAAFLQGRIKAVQDADESASWRDQLSHALDYRRWHRFVVERQQDGQWRRLDRRTYGTGSGGEKALALTLPRFAAAAAHYRSAAKTAPRLVMLDEAFAGIDPTMRAQCLGVLTQFDLDVIMTSELEWGCYPTVPSLAIYHLTTLAAIDAVAATRWIWNGRERKQLDPPLTPDAPPAESAPAPAELAPAPDALP